MLKVLRACAFVSSPSLVIYALEKRYHLLGVVWLLSSPEDVIDLEIFRRKFDELGNINTLSSCWVYVLEVAILNRNPGGNDSGR